MSWSATVPAVRKEDFDAAIDALARPDYLPKPGEAEGEHDDRSHAAACQFNTAKKVAKQMAESLPGPYLYAMLSGHANATGWETKDGWATEAINVNVCQVNKAPEQK